MDAHNETMIHARDARRSRRRWATTIKAATLVVMLGSLAAVWHPLDMPRLTAAPAGASPAAAAGPDMTVYFPDRFAAPSGVDEPQPPTF
jgi:hypothetical protein